MGINFMKILFLFLALFSSATFAKDKIIIGDSISCGSFGKHMAQKLSRGRDQITLYCAVSSRPDHWLDGKQPGKEICQTWSTGSKENTLTPCGGTGHVPTLAAILQGRTNIDVLVALGTNSLSDGANSTYTKMAKMIKDAKLACHWIGPPHMDSSKGSGARLDARLPAFYQSLNAIESFCPVKDSRPFTQKGTPGFETHDGIHRTKAAGIYWADMVVKLVYGF
jgi:hypothetical protein